MKLIFSSQNKNKIKEMKELFKDTNIEIVSLIDLDFHDDIEENGKTFKENAYIKSKYIFDKYNLPVFSDDSGLEVDALNGEPGVYSARYSGLGSEGNIDKLLNVMKNEKNRKADFNCTICLYINKDEQYYFEGKCFGNIGYERIGNDGFGYDPIFMINEKDSFATISLEEKNKISHRGIATRKLYDFLNKKYK